MTDLFHKEIYQCPFFIIWLLRNLKLWTAITLYWVNLLKFSFLQCVQWSSFFLRWLPFWSYFTCLYTLLTCVYNKYIQINRANWYCEKYMVLIKSIGCVRGSNLKRSGRHMFGDDAQSKCVFSLLRGLCNTRKGEEFLLTLGPLYLGLEGNKSCNNYLSSL